MSLNSPEDVAFFVPMLEILAHRPGAITLRTIQFAITSSRLKELKSVQRFYSHCLGNCISKKCQKESFLKTEFDPYRRSGHDMLEIEFDGKPIQYSTAQCNFFRVFIETGNLAKIIALREEIEAEIRDMLMQREEIEAGIGEMPNQ